MRGDRVPDPRGSTSTASAPTASEWELRSEFAIARVALDTSANGPRLRVRDVGSGAEIYLDPFELISLARSRHERLRALVLPDEYVVESDEWALHHH
jgi:hypothetical protein